MKKVLFLILTVMLVACGPSAEEREAIKRAHMLDTSTYGVIPSDNLSQDITYHIVVIDDCEYIVGYSENFNGGPILTHKGNCKNHNNEKTTK